MHARAKCTRLKRKRKPHALVNERAAPHNPIEPCLSPKPVPTNTTGPSVPSMLSPLTFCPSFELRLLSPVRRANLLQSVIERAKFLPSKLWAPVGVSRRNAVRSHLLGRFANLERLFLNIRPASADDRQRVMAAGGSRRPCCQHCPPKLSHLSQLQEACLAGRMYVPRPSILQRPVREGSRANEEKADSE